MRGGMQNPGEEAAGLLLLEKHIFPRYSDVIIRQLNLLLSRPFEISFPSLSLSLSSLSHSVCVYLYYLNRINFIDFRILSFYLCSFF